MPVSTGGRKSARTVLGVVCVVAATLGWLTLERGWLPHDEGTLAHSAERVLHGELPHRDFDEVYTGGLSMLDAAAFRLFGTSLRSLRLPLFVVFLVWVPALYYLATRFAPPALAGGVTLLGAIWSFPQYREPMPSWYNLFLATFGIAALLRHLETGRRRWVALAGVAGGLSILVKVTGLYYVAGVLLFLVFREAACGARRPGRISWAAPYPVAIGAGLFGLVAALAWLVHTRLATAEVVHFVLPGAALAGLAYYEVATRDGVARQRFAALFRLLWPFALGVALPIVVFLVPYVRSGAVNALVAGTFVAPARRLDSAASPLPGVLTLFAAVPVALLVDLLPWPSIRGARPLRWALLVALLTFLVLSKHPVWYAIRPLLPLTVLAGSWLLWRRPERSSSLQPQQVFLILSVTALCSLVQFPFARPIYFFYIAPLVAIAVLAVLALRRPPLRTGPIPAMVLGAFLIAGVVNFHPSNLHLEPLALERGGIDVPAKDGAVYASLVRLIRTHATGGYFYAAPDCPQLYFLTGLENPTRVIWDFLADSVGMTGRVLRTLEERRITAVVINQRPPFSDPLPRDLLDSLSTRFPRSEAVERFVVRWRP